MVEIHPEHARSVLDNLALGVVLLDRNEHISWVNEYACAASEQPASALLGRRPGDVGLPYAPLSASSAALEVRTAGQLVGLTQRSMGPGGFGTVLLLFERDHALLSAAPALGALASASGAIGALPRAATAARFEAEVSRSRRYENALSCITVRFPPNVGRAVVDDVARLLKGQLRWVDLLGLWQQDVLLVILPETGAAAGETLCDKLAAVLAAQPAHRALRCGVATWRRGDQAEQLVARALARAQSAAGG